MVNRSTVQYYNCQKLGHLTREFNTNKKEPQEDKAKVTRQEFGDENTLLVMIIEVKCNRNRLQDSSSSLKKHCRTKV